MDFFESLSFSSSNEDGRSELRALSGPTEKLVCLTGSGTRPLDMLLSDANQVIALDLNPMQNALLELKIAAFQSLDYDALLAFLGLVKTDDRMALYAQVRRSLRPEMQAHWDQNLREIGRGIWYMGLWEKVLRIGAKGVRMLRGKAVPALFNARDVAEQKAIWDQQFDDWVWRSSIRTLGRPWFWTRVIGEPGGAFLPGPEAVEQRLAGCFSRAAGQFLFRESDFASLVLRGTNVSPLAVPLHLKPKNFERIRTRLSDLRIVTGGLGDLADLRINQVDAFSLSDFGSYCDDVSYSKMWAGVIGAAAPNARFCERVFMNDLAPPDERIRLDHDLSDHLTTHDRAIIYDIRAGHIA